MRLRKRQIALVALTVIPFVAAVLWVGSYVSHDRYVWAVGTDSWGIVNCNGRLQVRVIRHVMPTGYQRLRGVWAGDQRGNWENDGVVLRSSGFGALGWHRGGVEFEGSWAGTTPPPAFLFTYSTFAVSHWLIVGITLLPAGAALYRMWRVKAEARRRGFPVVAQRLC